MANNEEECNLSNTSRPQLDNLPQGTCDLYVNHGSGEFTAWVENNRGGRVELTEVESTAGMTHYQWQGAVDADYIYVRYGNILYECLFIYAR